MDETFVITRDWVMRHSFQGRGGWTHVQLSLLKVPWPPRHGWLKRLVGRTIPQTTARAFEQARKPAMPWHLKEPPQTHHESCPRVKKARLTVEGVDVRSREFLSTYAWRQLRMRVLTKHGPRCMCCGAVPTPTNGVVVNVDHIQSRLNHPELALVESNLQVLCHVCNHGKGNWDDTNWRGARAATALTPWGYRVSPADEVDELPHILKPTYIFHELSESSAACEKTA